MTIKYNWQHANWPKFTYQSSGLHKIIEEYTRISSHLQGQVSQLNQDNRSEAYIFLMVEEAINTSEIEGENLNREEVRSSVARYLDLDLSQPKGIFHKETGIASLLIDVRRNFTSELSKEMICNWHKLLLTGQGSYYAKREINIGEYRTGSVDIVSGSGDYEEVVFEGPPGDIVDSEMKAFFDWYNSTSHLNDNSDYVSGPVRSAIAHMWFTSIHPFGDGNGRIARAISEHALFQDFDIPPLFSISTAINDNRNDYYKMLAESSRIHPSVDLTNWVKWFVEITKNAQIDAKSKIDFILKKSIFWDHHKETKLNKRQQKITSKFFEFGTRGLIKTGINSEKYQAMTGCSSATATRDLKAMVEKGILVPSQSGGRSLRYFINLVEEKPVFNAFQKGHDKNLIEVSINKLLDDIVRNINFHQGQNKQLARLIDKYKAFADGEQAHLEKLDNILTQLPSTKE
ncbi:MAG: Fic family protein [Colwellia sp.]|nr:Fic family protein [Colwellia sp.]